MKFFYGLITIGIMATILFFALSAMVVGSTLQLVMPTKKEYSNVIKVAIEKVLQGKEISYFEFYALQGSNYFMGNKIIKRRNSVEIKRGTL